MSEPGSKHDTVDVLYEGGDESGLDEAARGELAKWRELRGVMREVGAASEAEPPDTMGILMAAAREHAPAPRGVWARLRRWMAVMVAHPAMSAAATVVIAGGVAGALYASGKVGSETRSRSESTVAAPAPPPVAPSVPSEDHAEGQAAPPQGSAAGSGSAAVAFEAEAPEPDLPPAKAKVEAPPKPTKHATSPQPASKPAPEIGASGDADGVIALDDGEDVKTAPTTPAPAPPPPPPPPPAPAPDNAPVAKAPAADQGRVAVPDPAALTREAKAAAKKKDCKTVDALATRVIQLDERYYRANFAPDPDIRSNCDAATRR